MALAKDYDSVMGRSNDIMKVALGLDYEEFERGGCTYRLHVVVQDVRALRQDDVQQIFAPLHVRDQQLDGRVRALRPELPEAGGELLRALVEEMYSSPSSLSFCSCVTPSGITPSFSVRISSTSSILRSCTIKFDTLNRPIAADITIRTAAAESGRQIGRASCRERV